MTATPGKTPTTTEFHEYRAISKLFETEINSLQLDRDRHGFAWTIQETNNCEIKIKVLREMMAFSDFRANRP